MAKIAQAELVIGLEVHVELSTRSKMFATVGNIVRPEDWGREPNEAVDAMVLGLPGSLPVINVQAVEKAMAVGLALGCEVSHLTRWDRKGYFYPDLPKGYQVSQYDRPLCEGGAVELPACDEQGRLLWDAPAGGRKIRIRRAHLEEDAGKLLHEWPGTGAGGGGQELDCSIVDLNRAGAPLLEIVTEPDFRTAGEVVAFCAMLRDLVRYVGASEAVIQRGHIRFEPNVNMALTLDDGRVVRTPIVEVKNLNSYRAVWGAVEYERAEQPGRWAREGLEMGPGTKSTRGWDGVRTVVQREKEEAADYRYFPDPDLLPLRVDRAWVDRVRAGLPETAVPRGQRYVREYGLSGKEAAALVGERGDAELFEGAVTEAQRLGVPAARGGRVAANILLQSGAKRVNLGASPGEGESGEVAGGVSGLGISARAVGGLVKLREDNAVSAAGIDELFGAMCLPEHAGADVAEVARTRGLLMVKDEAAETAWVSQAIGEQPAAAADVRAGKEAAVGRIVGAAMKLAGGKGDAKSLRERILRELGQA